jgi:hypothetical protein
MTEGNPRNNGMADRGRKIEIDGSERDSRTKANDRARTVTVPPLYAEIPKRR